MFLRKTSTYCKFRLTHPYYLAKQPAFNFILQWCAKLNYFNSYRVYIFATVLISGTKYMSRQVLWFIFNLRIKKNRVSYTCNHTAIIIVKHSNMELVSLPTHYFIHTWATRHCQHCSKWVDPCSSLKADWAFLLATWHETPNHFPCRWLGMAIFSLACLDLTVDQSPNSNSYKSHMYVDTHRS
jgi:hypothetical protein